MFDRITARYDLLNHLLSFFQDYYWRSVLSNCTKPHKDKLILDLAAGTGDSSVGPLKGGATVAGADLSFGMLRCGSDKLKNQNFRPVQSSAYELPFRDSVFDSATCAFGIRNMYETKFALAEVLRVLKPGGRFVILEFSPPSGVLLPFYRFYLTRVMPMLAGLISKNDAYRYLASSIEKFPPPSEFSSIILSSGFAVVEKRPLSFGCVHIYICFKHS